MAAIVEDVSSQPGRHIFFQGDIATEFLVVAQGNVRVYIPGQATSSTPASWVTARCSARGACLDGGPRGASAIALEPLTEG